MSPATIRPERDWSAANGGCLVAGVDEAGRGPLAGPVVAAAVIFDLGKHRPAGLADSKTLSEKQRERLFPRIQRAALAFGIGVATAGEIDLHNILGATRLAAKRAVESLAVPADALVTDALEIPALPIPQLPIIKGDAKSASIAAASILAKVTRDRLMDGYHIEFPAYGWDSNRGYPTQDHYAAIARYGPTTLHRMTFSGVDFFCEQPLRSPSFHELASQIGDGVSTPVLRARIESRRSRLPPPDRERLLELLAART